MAARPQAALVILALVIGVCSVAGSESVVRVALLAPFEGRYREIGYNALYAARLAVSEANSDVQLLAIDDGGGVQTAVTRSRALAHDPSVRAVLTLGIHASDTRVQEAFGDLPVIIVGYWSTHPVSDTVFMLANPELDRIITLSSEAGLTGMMEFDELSIGGELFALAQVPKLYSVPEVFRIVSSGSLPGTAFRESYVNSDPFAPEPGLLASLTYDATRMALLVAQGSSVSRNEVQRALADMRYEGLNGKINFEDRYWVDAPIRYYQFNSAGQLIPGDNIIE
jgi:ABC-type branched-subunit amino acid transport system substrate-binding protein